MKYRSVFLLFVFFSLSFEMMASERFNVVPKTDGGFRRVSWNDEIFTDGDSAWEITLNVDDRSYRNFKRLESEEVSTDGSRRMILQATESNETVRLVLEIQPVAETRAGAEWTGFRYRYLLPDDSIPGATVEETVSWHRAQTGPNPVYWFRNVYFATEYESGLSKPLPTPGGGFHSRFGKILPFDFHEGNACAFLVYPEEPVLILNQTTTPKDRCPAVSDRFFLTPTCRSTPWKRVLTNDSWPTNRIARINRFNRLWLELGEHYREKAGLQTIPPLLPLVQLGTRFSQVELVFDELKSMGFSAFSVGPIWTSSATEGGGRASMSTYDFTVAEQWGGLEGLRDLCRKAAEHDLKVFAWFPAFHLSDQSPLLETHPEWKARPCRENLYQDKLVPLNLSDPALREHLRKSLRIVREAGLSGFWLDSFHNYGMEVVLPRDGWVEPTTVSFLETLREMQEMGFTLYAEAYTPFVATSSGILKGRLPYYEKAEYRLPRAIPYPTDVRWGSDLEGVDCFAFLAYGTPLFLMSNLSDTSRTLWAFSGPERERLARWQTNYARVIPYMKSLHGLIADGKAVLWKDDAGTFVLFALEDFEFTLPPGHRAFDVETGEPFPETKTHLLKSKTVYGLRKTGR